MIIFVPLVMLLFEMTAQAYLEFNVESNVSKCCDSGTILVRSLLSALKTELRRQAAALTKANFYSKDLSSAAFFLKVLHDEVSLQDKSAQLGTLAPKLFTYEAMLLK